MSCDRDALSDLALHFLNKMKIMVVKEIEREDIEFICKVSVITSTTAAVFSQHCSTLFMYSKVVHIAFATVIIFFDKISLLLGTNCTIFYGKLIIS